MMRTLSLNEMEGLMEVIKASNGTKLPVKAIDFGMNNGIPFVSRIEFWDDIVFSNGYIAEYVHLLNAGLQSRLWQSPTSGEGDE